MSDIAERVRALCPHDVSGYCECTAQEAADKIIHLEIMICRQSQIIYDLKEQLATCQAREKVLRDAVGEWLNGHTNESHDRLYEVWAENQQTDDTALNNLLAEGQAREKVLRVRLGHYQTTTRTQRH